MNRHAGDWNDITFEEGMIVLKWLTVWRFNIGRKKIFEWLRTSADPVTKILVYQQYEWELHYTVWLLPSVELPARRTNPLDENEVRRLGAGNTAKIASIREDYSCCCRGKWYFGKESTKKIPNCCSRAEYDFKPRISTVF